MTDLARKVKRGNSLTKNWKSHNNSENFFSYSSKNRSSEFIANFEESSQCMEKFYLPFKYWEFDENVDIGSSLSKSKTSKFIKLKE